MSQNYTYFVLSGMVLLCSWGVSCVLYGRGYQKLAPSVTKYCRQMTLYWGIINALLGAYALASVLFALDMYTSNTATRQQARRIFGFNVVLDIAYIIVGLVTAYAGRQVADRRRGFGLAIVAQGTFLVMLDGILSTLH